MVNFAVVILFGIVPLLHLTVKYNRNRSNKRAKIFNVGRRKFSFHYQTAITVAPTFLLKYKIINSNSFCSVLYSQRNAHLRNSSGHGRWSWWNDSLLIVARSRCGCENCKKRTERKRKRKRERERERASKTDVFQPAKTMSNRSSRGLYSSRCSVFGRLCIYRRPGTRQRKSDSK